MTKGSLRSETDNRRLNRGNGGQLPILFDNIEYENPDSSSLETWTLHDRGDKDDSQRWKLCAQEGTSVLGKANYSLTLKGNNLFTKDDGSFLKEERPGLFAIVEQIAKGFKPPTESLDDSGEDDPYGDLAISRGRKINQAQEWNRELLSMRVRELHWECRPDKDNLPPGVVRAESWELGVRQAWFGVFHDNWEKVLDAHKNSIAKDAHKFATTHFTKDSDKPEIRPDWNRAILKLARHLTVDAPEGMVDDAIAYIKRRGTDPISYDAYTQALAKYHKGEFKPLSCATLAATLDIIAGVDSENPALAVDEIMDLL